MLVNEQEARQGRKGTCPSNDIPHSTHSIPNTKLSNNCSAYEWAYTERTFVNQNIHFHTQALFTAEVNSNSASGMVSVGGLPDGSIYKHGPFSKPCQWEGE